MIPMVLCLSMLALVGCERAGDSQQGRKSTDGAEYPASIVATNYTLGRFVKPLVVVAGTLPKWTTELSRSVRIINVFPDSAVSIQPAANPRQAIGVLAKLRTGITENIPDITIKKSFAEFAEQVTSYKEKWKKLSTDS